LCFSPGEQRNLPGHNNFSEKKNSFLLVNYLTAIINVHRLLFVEKLAIFENFHEKNGFDF